MTRKGHQLSFGKNRAQRKSWYAYVVEAVEGYVQEQFGVKGHGLCLSLIIVVHIGHGRGPIDGLIDGYYR